jgi:hypothetical protein
VASREGRTAVDVGGLTVLRLVPAL